MKSENQFENKHILVLGFAKTGKSVAHFLADRGAHVTINDRGDHDNDPSVALLLQKGVKTVFGGHPLSLLNEPVDFIVKNPGIPYKNDVIQVAQQKNIPIITDVELAYLVSDAAIIGITGSNGKTTTTSFIHSMLLHKPVGKAFVAGNIGVPTLDVVQQATKEDDLVMELSSFQLKGTQKFKPAIAVICNIFDAHLDYHETREDYVTSKFNLVRHLTDQDYMIYNYDQEELRQTLSHHDAIHIPFAIECVDAFVKEHGVYVEDDVIMFQKQAIANVEDIFLPGKHNLQNAMAAIAVALIKEIPIDKIQEVLRTFSGMPHRLQPIGQYAGRQFFNDSKSTNQVACITALQSFRSPIIYIGGGLDRGNEFDELVPHLRYVKAAYLYGESKYKMQSAFDKAKIAEITVVDTLEDATKKAYLAAQKGDTVLFSPSCASWDQFDNFETRGDLFVSCVHKLAQAFPYND